MLDSSDITIRFDRKRRKDGLILGLLAGFTFGIVSQGINHLILPGIAFYQPPFGAAGNLLLWMVIGSTLGLVTAWAGASLFGLLVGSLLAGLILQISAFLSGNLAHNLPGKLVGLIGFFLPFAALAAPLLGLVRLAVNEQREWYDLPFFSWQRLRMPLLLVLLCAGLGALWLFPPDGQVCISQMNQMIRAGLKSSPAALPKPLQDPLVGPFLERSTPDFTIELDRQNLTRFMIPYFPRGQFQPSAVISRFSSNWTLVCLYIDLKEDPYCRGYQNLDQETSIGQADPGITDDHGIIHKP